MCLSVSSNTPTWGGICIKIIKGNFESNVRWCGGQGYKSQKVFMNSCKEKCDINQCKCK